MLKKYLMITMLCLGASLASIQTVSASTNPASVSSTFNGFFNTKASYKKLGVCTASSYLNIRSQQSTDSEIIGRLYSGDVAVVKSIKDDWVKISSGTVTGYVSKPYLTIGSDAQKLLIKSAKPVVSVNTLTLRVRKSKSTSSQVLGLVTLGDQFQVLSRTSKWTKIKFNNTTGYLSNDYIDLSYSFTYAVPVEQSSSDNREEVNSSDTQGIEDTTKPEETTESEETAETEGTTEAEETAETEGTTEAEDTIGTENSTVTDDTDSVVSDMDVSYNTGSSIGNEIAAFAQQFLGNPYASGGTSLTDGADCSGFLLAVFNQFGYTLPRTSKEQALSGIQVTEEEIQPGDIIAYASNGIVNHVAMYVGNGLAIHSSTPKDGIKLIQYNYREIYSIRRIAI